MVYDDTFEQVENPHSERFMLLFAQAGWISQILFLFFTLTFELFISGA